jgi:muconolactone delta-isomerase
MPPDRFYPAIESDGAAVAPFTNRPGLALIARISTFIAGSSCEGQVTTEGMVGSVHFLVICRSVDDRDEEEFRRLVPAETAVLRDLKVSGALTGAWSPGHPGAVLMMEASTAGDVADMLAGLPLVQRGFITTDVIPLYPIDL